jgi:hypothetical protein
MDGKLPSTGKPPGRIIWETLKQQVDSNNPKGKRCKYGEPEH